MDNVKLKPPAIPVNKNRATKTARDKATGNKETVEVTKKIGANK